ncbi:MAG: hypothetical protein QNJ31_04920 [Candidatus Caenarcaniphilales bacterium]|nr:hypothetical protein [Candidatus Caenarcaniphilales bacterium]
MSSRFLKKNINRYISSGSEISKTATISEKDVYFEFPIHIAPNTSIAAAVQIGKYSFINSGSVIYPNVYIGSYVSLGRNVQIGLAQHPVDWLSSHTFQYGNGQFPNDDKFTSLKKQSHKMHKDTVVGSDV